MSVRQVRQTERIRPSRTAERYLLREWGMCRYVWNSLVRESQDAHLFNQIATTYGATSTPTFGYADQDKYLTMLRATTTDPDTGEHWLAAGSSVAQQQTVRDFAAARTTALLDRKNVIPASRRRGLPRFKSRHHAAPSMNYTRRGFRLKPHPTTGTTALALPGGVIIPVVWSRPAPADPASVRVFRDSLGHWYASFVTDTDITELPTVGTSTAIGVDWGVTDIATTAVVDLTTGNVDHSTMFDLPHPHHGKTAAAKLSRYQKMMARRRPGKGQPGSAGYRHARHLAAKTHKKITRQRQDDARKWARNLVKHHDRIAVEDFKPKFLAHTTMARAAADAQISTVKTELVWQATKHGRDLRLVNPRHTTTDCSSCGARTKHRIPLSQRTYICDTCGFSSPRDKNSATIMVARAGFDPADIEGIRREPAAVREPAA